MTQAKSIVEQLIDSLSDCYSKLSLDQYSQAVVSKLIQQILKTYLYYESPTNLLVKALKEDESKLISKINPVLEIYSIFQLLENHNEEVSLSPSSTINHLLNLILLIVKRVTLHVTCDPHPVFPPPPPPPPPPPLSPCISTHQKGVLYHENKYI